MPGPRPSLTRARHPSARRARTEPASRSLSVARRDTKRPKPRGTPGRHGNDAQGATGCGIRTPRRTARSSEGASHPAHLVPRWGPEEPAVPAADDLRVLLLLVVADRAVGRHELPEDEPDRLALGGL